MAAARTSKGARDRRRDLAKKIEQLAAEVDELLAQVADIAPTELPRIERYVDAARAALAGERRRADAVLDLVDAFARATETRAIFERFPATPADSSDDLGRRAAEMLFAIHEHEAATLEAYVATHAPQLASGLRLLAALSDYQNARKRGRPKKDEKAKPSRHDVVVRVARQLGLEPPTAKSLARRARR